MPLRVLFALFLLASTAALHAGVTGRYVCFGNALSEAMSLSEVEVLSGDRNLIRNRPEVFTRGLEYGFYMIKRSPETLAQMKALLVDGKCDTNQRVDVSTAVGGGYLDISLYYASIELDLGAEQPLDRVAVTLYHYAQKGWNDLGWRYLVVLDAQRRIVAWDTFNVYGEGWKKNEGRWVRELQPATGAPAGRVVPAAARAWLSEAEFIRDFLGKPVVDLVKEQTAADQARLARFQRRNDPAEIAALGERFFRVVDLHAPGLDETRALVAAGQYAAALEAFKKPFFARLAPLQDWNAGEGTCIYVDYSWNTEPDTRYSARSRDLRSGVFGDKSDLSVKRFTPGLLPPGKFCFPFQMRPLLLNYAVSRDVADLRLWEAMTDDWALGFQDAADQAPDKLRDYFVLDLGAIRGNLKDLYMASQSAPEFTRQLSGATLARFLMPVLEELPVANWRVIRKCNFNHTYNGIPGGLNIAPLLDEFRAVQRLERELHQAFERQYTLSQYRDGSMVEIGDEGHYLATVSSPANTYGTWVNRGAPAWFTPALETYFLDNYRANILSHVANVSPSGAHVRWNAQDDGLLSFENELDLKDPYWRNVSGGRMSWGDYYPVLCLPTLREPAPRAVIDTVYGRGRQPDPNKNRAKEIEAVAKVYGGEYDGAPAFLSDWLPYSGLWYFRGGWSREAAFLHMVKAGNANNMGGAILYPVTNRYGAGQFNDTTYRFHDYATPLLTGLGVLVDGLPPCPEENRNPSGSKQDTFTQAIEKPQSGRWHTDALLDFGEASYQGVYRSVGLEFDHKLRKSLYKASAARVAGVTTTRQIVQVRPARLFLQVDRLRYATPGEQHANRIENTVILTAPSAGNASWEPNAQVRLQPEAQRLDTANGDNPGLTIAWFGQPALALDCSKNDLGHTSFGMRGNAIPTLKGPRQTTGRIVSAEWSATGETVLISLLRSRPAGEEPLRELTDLSSDTAAGVRATLADGTVVSLLVARRLPASLALGRVQLDGEALLLVEQPGQEPAGYALGVTQLQLDGKRQKLAAADLRFTLGEPSHALGFIPLSSGLTASPVRRPLDPPSIGPDVTTFTDSTTVSITSASPDVDLYYLAETKANEPAGGQAAGRDARLSLTAQGWQRYTRPFTIRESTFVRARAFRKGVTAVPFTSDGTAATAISYGFFQKRPVKPALAAPPPRLEPGLAWDYLEDRWFALWTYTDQLLPKATGSTAALLDVAMRQTAGPFAVRYHGYLDIPADGIYTFFGPDEFVNNTCEPGYDLRLFIDGEEWYLGQTWHGRGQWSVPLAKGLHAFRVTFADARDQDPANQRIDLWRHYPWAETTWKGTAPVIEVAGPALARQPLPNAWFRH